MRRKEFDAAVVNATRRLQRGKDVCNRESAVTGHLPVGEAVGRERCPRGQCQARIAKLDRRDAFAWDGAEECGIEAAANIVPEIEHNAAIGRTHLRDDVPRRLQVRDAEDRHKFEVAAQTLNGSAAA